MAGTIAITSRTPLDYSRGSTSKRAEVIQIDWVADAADGSVPTLSVPVRGFLYKAITNPGSTAPTANYDIALGDPEDTAIDALNGALANRHTTNSEQVYPAIAGSPGTVTSFTPFLAGTYTLAITNNSVNSATGRILLYVLDEV